MLVGLLNQYDRGIQSRDPSLNYMIAFDFPRPRSCGRLTAERSELQSALKEAGCSQLNFIRNEWYEFQSCHDYCSRM